MTHNTVSWNILLHSYKERDDQAEKFGAVNMVENKIMKINCTNNFLVWTAYTLICVVERFRFL